MKIPAASVENAVSADGYFFAEQRGFDHVLLNVEKGMVVATDGHMLVRTVAEIEEGDTTGLIPIAAFLKARSQRGSGASIQVKKDGITVLDAGEDDMGDYPRPESVKPFPETDNFFRGFAARPNIVVNICILRKLLSAIENAHLDSELKPIGIWIKPGKDGMPSKEQMLIAPMHGDCAGVMMPVNPDFYTSTAEQVCANSIGKEVKQEKAVAV